MATTGDPNKAALLVVDVQNGVMANGWNADQVIANIARMVDAARKAEILVVWVQHEHEEELPRDSQPWQIVPGLQPADGETHIYKRFNDSFAETDLGDVLTGKDVGHVVISGAQTNACIRATSYGAINRGYDVTLVEDAHTTESFDVGDVSLDAAVVVLDANLGMQFAEYPGVRVGTATTEEVVNW